MKNNLRIKYHLLKEMGFSTWHSKKALKNAVLSSPVSTLCAYCLVLLPKKPELMSIEAQTIFSGMLKVLSLKTENIGIYFLNESVETLEKDIHKMLLSLAPYTVLLMGETLTRLLFKASFESLREDFQTLSGSDIIVKVTYDPEVLQEAPLYKKEAYKDLLKLKKQLTVLGV